MLKPNFMYLHICDDVRNEIGGKISMMGVYEKTLIVPSIPFVFPKLCFYSRFSGITENHIFNFSLTNPSGDIRKIIENSPCFPEEGEDQGIFNVVATPFEIIEEGKYVATIEIEERENIHTYTKEFYVYDGNKLNKTEE